MVQNGCGNGLGVAVAMTAIATRFAVILAESGLAPMSKKVAQKSKYFAHVYTVTRTTWDLDIFSNYDYDAHVGVKPCDGEIALEVHRILQDRLVKEGQRPPYSSAGLHTDTSRVSLLYTKPRTAKVVQEYIRGLGVFDVAPFCFVVPTNISFCSVSCSLRSRSSTGSSKDSRPGQGARGVPGVPGAPPRSEDIAYDQTVHETYSPLPDGFAHCSFEKGRWSQRTAVIDCLKKEGFVVLRDFVPESFCLPVRQHAAQHMKRVLLAFDHPYTCDIAGDDFSCLANAAQLPGRVWMKNSARDSLVYNPLAIEQNWGFSTSMGYQADIGSGQVFRGDVKFMTNEWLVGIQEYLRPYIALVEGVCPQHLLREPEGVSLKGQGSPELALHVDPNDADRNQVVISLSHTAFVVVPKSATPTGDRAFHLNSEDKTQLRKHMLCFSCSPGDVLIFDGGVVVHGSPAVPNGMPHPRIVTYCKYWAARSKKGAQHMQKCLSATSRAMCSVCQRMEMKARRLSE
jgi:hypothetical protein